MKPVFRRPILAFFAVCSLSAAPALAAGPLTLDEAMATAIAHSPRLKASALAVEAAKAREQQAAAPLNPNVSVAVDQVPLPNPIAGNYMAGLSQPLLPLGNREARIELAEAETALAGLDYAADRLDLAIQVRRAYARLLYARAILEQTRREAEVGARLLDATRSRFKAGEVAKVVTLRAEVDQSRLERAVAEAASRELQACGRLNVLLGRPVRDPLAIAPLPLPKKGALPPVDRLLAEGLANRPELKRAELAISREGAQRRVVSTGVWSGSELSFAAGAVGGAPGFTTSVSLPVPINRRQGELAEAEANQARAEADRDAVAASIALEVEEAYREATIAAGQVALFQSSYVPQAERLADNARRRFTAGEGSGVEVIEALKALHETRQAFEEAVLAYREAEAALAHAAGHPTHTPQENLK